MGGVAWTEEEDHLLRKCIEQYGEGKWHRVPLLAGLNRCRKSCRLRWLNYLRPNIKRGSFAEEEVDLIIKLHKLLGNRWSLIAGRLPGRTANDVKNYWNCHLSKRLGPQDVDQTQDTKLQLAANPSPASPGAAVEIIRPHPRSISAASARPPSPNYGAFQEEQGSTSTVPPPPPSMLFVEDNGGESSSWVIHSSKGKDGGMGMGSCCYQGMEDHHQVGGILAGGSAVAGEEMIGMDFRFEQVQVSCGDESCSSKWDWDDLICDMDLWGESL